MTCDILAEQVDVRHGSRGAKRWLASPVSPLLAIFLLFSLLAQTTPDQPVLKAYPCFTFGLPLLDFNISDPPVCFFPLFDPDELLWIATRLAVELSKNQRLINKQQCLVYVCAPLGGNGRGNTISLSAITHAHRDRTR
jgi:hypothetical protein